jgi:maltokinase
MMEDLLPAYLGKQRWFGGNSTEPAVDVVDRAELAERLQWLLVHAEGATYQLLIGGKPMGDAADFLAGREAAVVGEDDGRFYYDATFDPELALELLGIVTKGTEAAERVRPMGVEQSNTSLVFDDRLILKVFRRLSPGRNPDVEVTTALADLGFDHVPHPVATWERDGYDLSIVQDFLIGGAEGWALALTSLRDLYATGPDDPGEAGGDFASEARRLGEMTAELHVTMGQAFGAQPGDAKAWADGINLDALDAGDRDAAQAFVERLRKVKSAGSAVRVHGDYHLGQVMRTDTGWYVLDFEGEPVRPLEDRVRPTSPLKDVSGMLRSFHYASRAAMESRDKADWPALEPLAEAWESRNRDAFLDGYRGVEAVHALLPRDQASFRTVLSAFELDKAVYELAYERSYRPDWVEIPLAAIRRLLRG